MYVDKIGSKLPDFLIVGAARSGTTTLFSLLAESSEIFMPKEKEPMFFFNWNQSKRYFFLGENKKIKADYIVNKLEEYKAIFKAAKDNQIIGESSTWYLYAYKIVIPNIKEMYGKNFGKMKIIIMLRNPVHRAWSHYWQKRKEGHEPLSFPEVVKKSTIKYRLEEGGTLSYDYLGFGRYYNQVKAYMDNFSNVKILIFEDFIKNTQKSCIDILRFLEKKEFIKINKLKHLNVSGTPKNFVSSVMDKIIFKPSNWRHYFKHIFPSEVRRDLRYYLSQKIYEKQELPFEYKKILENEYKKGDIKKLSSLIGKDLNHWIT